MVRSRFLHSTLLFTLCISLFSTQGFLPAAQASTVRLQVTDGKDYAHPGASLSYVIDVEALHPSMPDVDVRFVAPNVLDSLSPSHGGTVNGKTVVWNNLSLGADGHERLTVNAHVDPHVHEGTVIEVKVDSSGEVTGDITHVTSSVPPTAQTVALAVTDGKNFAVRGSVLEYQVTMKNILSEPQSLDLEAQLPEQFVLHAASGPHARDARKIHWRNIPLAPGETKTFGITGNIERRAPVFYTLRLRVAADSAAAVDSTTIVAPEMELPTSTNHALPQIESFRPPQLSISASSPEVAPGGRVTFVARLENRTPFPLRNVIVEGKFDPTLVRPAFAEQDAEVAPGDIRWRIGLVEPGKTWQARYAFQMNPAAPHGAQLHHTLQARGEGLSPLSRNAYVTASADGKVAVITGMPQAGAGVGGMASAAFGLLAAFGTLAQRRRWFV